jgi:hypothetical protein
MAKQQKTLRKQRWQSRTLMRTASAYIGAKKLLTLLSRAEDGENTIAPVATNAAVDVMQLTYNNF